MIRATFTHERCPCGSGKRYKSCCGPFHGGKFANNALQLMRSRYSAYALHLAGYIMATTHPAHPDQKRPRDEWESEIRHFAQRTKFLRLEILNFVGGEEVAFVTFIAHLEQEGKKIAFKEKSRFEKVDGRWYYESGTVSYL